MKPYYADEACTFWLNDRPCGSVAIDRYLPGPRCAAHTPSAVARRAEPPTPDPARTLLGLRAQAGRADVASPIIASQLYDDRAVASGKRRASPHAIRDARMRLGVTTSDAAPPLPPVVDDQESLFGEVGA